MAVQKGINNLNVEKQLQLKTLQINNFNLVPAEKNEFYDPLQQIFSAVQSHLENLVIENYQILDIPSIHNQFGVLIANSKILQQINLTNCLSNQLVNNFVDGLMRCKNLQIVNLDNNQQINDKSLSQIVYNLSFVPRLKHLSINNQTTVAKYPDFIEALSKLLKITTSLEVLRLTKLANNFVSQLKKEFFVSLGEIMSLKELDFTLSGTIDSNLAGFIGKAVAFNAKKQNQLEVLRLDSTIPNSNTIKQIYQAMNISEYDHEQWYGD